MNSLFILTFIFSSILGFFIGKFFSDSQNNSENNTKFIGYEAQIASLNTELTREKEDKNALKSEAEIIINKSIELEKQLSKIESDNRYLNDKITHQKSDIERIQADFKLQFENIANKILEENSNKFSKHSEKNLNNLLSPLKIKIDDFKKQVEETYTKESREKLSLEEQIKHIANINQKMTAEAASLTKALKGESKTQGIWGERILENILESSGLREGKEYIVQGKEMGWKSEDAIKMFTKPFFM